jgi:hypothetical protein
MAHQLLTTFYVQSPDAPYTDITVAARVQYASGNYWTEDTNQLRCTVSNAHYNDENGLRRRYKVDVFRTETSSYYNNQAVYYYPLSKAGTYHWRLQVMLNSNVMLERSLYITIQPDIHVYVGDGRRQTAEGGREPIDLLYTEEAMLSANPLVRMVEVIKNESAEAVAARTLALTKLNAYKENVFIRTNVPIDIVSNDLTEDTFGYGYYNNKWLQLKDAITVMRKIGTSDYLWGGYSLTTVIQNDSRGKFAPFVADSGNYVDYGNPPLLTYPYYEPVELGLEKPLLSNPLKIEANLQLYANGVNRYMGSGETTATTDPIILDLLAVLKTAHAIKIIPSVMTLDEDNNYTTFCAVEVNDDTDWTLEPVDSRLTVTPTSGTGRAAVVVKKADSFHLTGHFENVLLTAVSTASTPPYPDIDGFEQVSDTAEVHVEQYFPTHNALIPKMLSNTLGERGGEFLDNVTIAHVQNNTADELNAAYAYNASHAAFAITSTDDVLNIDASKPIVLDKIEITGVNVRRTIATGIAKGGAALSFSIVGTNDLTGAWTTLRDGSAITDFAALTNTTTAGNWTTSASTNFTISSTGTAAFRYYRLVPHNRSATGAELSYALHRLHLYEKVTATAVSMVGTAISDSRNTATTTLNNVATSTNGVVSINNPTYRFTVDFGEANPKKVDRIQITTNRSGTDDRLVQAPDGFIVSASNDGIAWTPVLVSDRPVAIGGTFAHWFDLAVTSPYRYYQIEITNFYNLSFTLSQVRFYEKGAGASVSCLLPKSPYLTCPQKWDSLVKIDSRPQTADSGSDAAYQSFDHSLTVNGFAGRFTVGMYSAATYLATNSGTLNPFALENLDQYPGVEVTFDTPHRIRSWSLQSVGNENYKNSGAVFESLATVLVLCGKTLDGRWKILDLVRSSDLYTATKIRVDRPVQHIELADKIRISAIAVQDSGLAYRGFVWFPQIQLFAGVPVLPNMGQYSGNDVQVRSNGGAEYDYYYGNERDIGRRVFDREVSGNSIARIGSRAWYINNNHFLLEDVADSGNISQFGSYQSKAWLALVFPRTRILGYLYSIDNLKNLSDNHANVSYAASLYFEGRETANNDAILAPSAQWDFIDLISLDRCIGHNLFGVPTENLIAETNQTTLNNYAAALGLPVKDRTFIMNRTDLHSIRYDAESEEWYDDGLRLEPGQTANLSNHFNNMTTDELLNQSGQFRLNSVAIERGATMQPPWTVIPDKASIVNQKDNRRMVYDILAETWDEVPNTDAIYHVDDRTHYADLKDSGGNPMLLAQLRCTAQSIVNTEKPSVGGEPVAMPEMQFFGLPAETINSGAVATITYLKAEDAAGKLHDLLGKHAALPYQRLDVSYNYGTYYTTYFRLYVGAAQNIKPTDRRLYFSIQGMNGLMTTTNVSFDNDYYSQPYREVSVPGDYTTSPTFFELYIYSANDEQIILSSGYTG